MKILKALAALCFSVGSFASFAQSAGQPKVGICHLSDDGTFHLIVVGEPAVPAHLAHGDVIAPAVGATVTVGDLTLDSNCDVVVLP